MSYSQDFCKPFFLYAGFIAIQSIYPSYLLETQHPKKFRTMEVRLFQINGIP